MWLHVSNILGDLMAGGYAMKRLEKPVGQKEMEVPARVLEIVIEMKKGSFPDVSGKELDQLSKHSPTLAFFLAMKDPKKHEGIIKDLMARVDPSIKKDPYFKELEERFSSA